jgi:DNA-binding response OmpR family regulator
MGAKILYSEDEIFLGKIVKESLETKGYNVCLVDDGNNVLPNFNSFEPNICLLDIMMPNKNGYEVATQIRQQNQQIPIIFLTAKSQTIDVVKGFEVGCNDYIRKPFSIEELIVRIENLLQFTSSISKNSNPDYIKIGSYTFEFKKQILMYQKTPKKLSYRETELIKYLLNNKNNVIERKSILELIWGSDSFFNSRNLDVYINKIRNYFSEDSNIELITLKGVGYRFLVNQ